MNPAMHHRGLRQPGSGPKAALRAALTVQAVVLVCSGVSVAEPTERAAYAACMARAGTTADMRSCQRAGLSDAGARLTAAYAKALAALPADQQTKLREAERRWLAFRSSDCGVFFGNRTGTIAPVQSGGCMIDRTETRIKNLQELLAR